MNTLNVSYATKINNMLSAIFLPFLKHITRKRMHGNNEK